MTLGASVAVLGAGLHHSHAEGRRHDAREHLLCLLFPWTRREAARREDAAARPSTFCFKGGPGASAVWLHPAVSGRAAWIFRPGVVASTAARVVDMRTRSSRDGSRFCRSVAPACVPRRARRRTILRPRRTRGRGRFLLLFTTGSALASPKYLLGESYGVLRLGGSRPSQNRHKMFSRGVARFRHPQLSDAGPAIAMTSRPHFPSGLTATAHYHKRSPPICSRFRRKRLCCRARIWQVNTHGAAQARR